VPSHIWRAAGSFEQYMVFKKELYNGIPNVTVWRVLRKRLRLKVYKRLMIFMPLSVNIFVTLATQQHLEYHCTALFKHPALPVEVTLSRNYPG
jgi:hypothetical protein